MLGFEEPAIKKLPRCFAVADANPLRQLGDLVEVLAGLFGHAELALAERGLHVFRSVARQRNLEIVDERRAVHRDSRNEAAIHQIDQDGPEAHLDHVPAHAPENGFAVLARRMHRAQELPEILRRENARQRIEESCQGYVRGGRLGEFAHVDLAFARCQRIRAHFTENQRRDRVDAHAKCFTLRRRAATCKKKLPGKLPKAKSRMFT